MSIRAAEAYAEKSMRRLASFITIFILLSTAAPLMACMTDRTMNQEESACCRAMHGKCDDAMATMGCCHTQVRTDEHPQLATSAPAIDLNFVVADWLEPVLSEIQNVPPSMLGIPDEYSPPGLVTARITILRI
jgi:hypothetical protein